MIFARQLIGARNSVRDERKRFSAPVQTGAGADSASYTLDKAAGA